jgi:hypothetical protein
MQNAIAARSSRSGHRFLGPDVREEVWLDKLTQPDGFRIEVATARDARAQARDQRSAVGERDDRPS